MYPNAAVFSDGFSDMAVSDRVTTMYLHPSATEVPDGVFESHENRSSSLSRNYLYMVSGCFTKMISRPRLIGKRSKNWLSTESTFLYTMSDASEDI